MVIMQLSIEIKGVGTLTSETIVEQKKNNHYVKITSERNIQKRITGLNNVDKRT